MAGGTWKATKQDYLEALQDQNPWAKLGAVPAALAKAVQRPLAVELWRTMIREPYRYQVVLGPRRVGKTVALYQSIQNLMTHGVPASRLWFLRLDHPLLMHYELGGWVKSLIRNFGVPNEPLFLFLDEVNYSKNWDKWLKTFFDEQWPVRVIATSSSTAALQNRTVESGIGRWSEQFLTPYTFSEFLSLRGEHPPTPPAQPDFLQTLFATIEARDQSSLRDKILDLFLLVGGFPELLDALKATNRNDMQEAMFRSQQVLRSEAVQRVAGMDIPQAFDIKNPLILERLLYVLAGQMCGLINISTLAADLELSRATIHQYINYLEQAYLIFVLPNYSKREDNVQKQGRKVYFVDGAVRNAALQRGVSPMDDPGESGYLLENAVASHLYSLALQSGGRLYHWRNRQEEVDFVYDEGGQPLAFEVAKRPGHHLRGLRALQARYPELHNRCFLVTSESVVFAAPTEDPDGVGRIPLAAFLLAVGVQTKVALTRRLGLT